MMGVAKINISTYLDNRCWHHWSEFEDVSGIAVSSRYGKTYRSALANLMSFSQCPYCGNEIKSHTFYPPPDYGNISFPLKTKTFDPKACSKCGWWFLLRSVKTTGMVSEEQSQTLYEGIIRKYDLDSLEIPNSGLRKYILKNIEKVRFLHPTKFEILVTDIFKDFFDCEVKHVGGPGDNGIDAYAVIGDEKHLIQTKRRLNLGSIESVGTVREFLGAIVAAGGNKGHIVTTAKDYSLKAKELVENKNLKERSVEINLISLSDLFNMLEIANKQLEEIWNPLCR
jgi:hypothetical protein